MAVAVEGRPFGLESGWCECCEGGMKGGMEERQWHTVFLAVISIFSTKYTTMGYMDVIGDNKPPPSTPSPASSAELSHARRRHNCKELSSINT